jgi:hypothetical protein
MDRKTTSLTYWDSLDAVSNYARCCDTKRSRSMIKEYCLSTSDKRNQNDNKYQSNAFERIFYFEYVNSLSHIQVSKQAYNFQDRGYCGRETATRQNQHEGQPTVCKTWLNSQTTKNRGMRDKAGTVCDCEIVNWLLGKKVAWLELRKRPALLCLTPKSHDRGQVRDYVTTTLKLPKTTWLLWSTACRTTLL